MAEERKSTRMKAAEISAVREGVSMDTKTETVEMPIESKESEECAPQRSARIHWGVIAAASVLAGGLVATWWYRKTLRRLHETDTSQQNPDFGSDSGEE